MSKETRIVCDRCGEEIKYQGWTAKLKKTCPNRFHILKLLNGNPDGYSYSERNYELCNHCTFELNRFFKGVKMVNEQREAD